MGAACPLGLSVVRDGSEPTAGQHCGRKKLSGSLLCAECGGSVQVSQVPGWVTVWDSGCHFLWGRALAAVLVLL